MINKVILVGNVGADPEVRTLESGVKTARLRLATTERMRSRDAQEPVEHTEWHTVTLWRNLADIVDRYVRKGSQLYIEGSLRTRDWTDQQGVKHYSTEIQANDMKLLGRRPEGAAPARQEGQPAQQYRQGGQQGYVQGGYQQHQQQYPSQTTQPQYQPQQPQEAPVEAPDNYPF